MSQNETHPLFQPSAEFVKQATVSGLAAYRALCEEAERDYTGYWAPAGARACELEASRSRRSSTNRTRRSTSGLPTANSTFPITASTATSRPDSAIRSPFFPKPTTARCAASPTANCSPRSANSPTVCAHRGFARAIALSSTCSMGIEGVIAMQACARIGAVHSVVFGGFSAQSVRDRINDAGAVAVITTDEQCRGGKKIPLKPCGRPKVSRSADANRSRK